MKKFTAIVILALFLITLAIPFAGLAEVVDPAPAATDEVVAETTTPEEDTALTPAAPEQAAPYTWQYLATLAGATAATLLIVQFCKVPLDKVWKIPTRVFVYLVALGILLVATAFTSGLTPDSVLLVAVNAFLVSLTAYGSYEVTFAKLNK